MTRSDSAAPRIRLICVDDNAEILAALRLIFDGSDGIETVACLVDPRELDQSIVNQRPDVVALDLWIPGQDSLAILRGVKEKHPHVNFLILSADDSDQHVERAFANGATGYELKDGNFERLARAIRVVARGEQLRPRSEMRGRSG
jgi:DNA-binding NarL/FixJ family response regulator